MPAPPRLIFAYHGCDAALARRVVCGEERLKASTNIYDWLGHGIYFWEDSPQRARKWAEQSVIEGKYQEAGVIGAIIDAGHCLNLVDAEYLAAVKEAYLGLKATMEAAEQPMPVNDGGLELRARKLDCAVFLYLHAMRKKKRQRPFSTVRAFFTEGKPLYPTAGIRERDHIQVCVRNPKQIIAYFLPHG